MLDDFNTYMKNVARKYINESTSEYGYRSDFEILLGTMFAQANIKDIQHDPIKKDNNKPDFVIAKNQVPVLYIETKNIGISLDKTEKTDQMARYFGYANLVLTDYLEFRFYRDGEYYHDPIVIGQYDKTNRSITPAPEAFQLLQDTLLDFISSHREPIKKGEYLAKIMGGKARRIRDNALQSFQDKKAGDLDKVYQSIKKALVHNLDISSFADMYAQTLVYGLFVARFHDDTPEDFSRSEARDLIPASNPFLRHFFDHIAGPEFDNRIRYIVDELCEVFQHADVAKLMGHYYDKASLSDGVDPVIHFYEDFLKEYDSTLRQKMGAYYTPEPVVKFIINSVDYILRSQFNLHAGLADASKTNKKFHKVQILDPAVGTGTFFSVIVEKIWNYIEQNQQQGRWHKYVYDDLLPRLHGFEIMMAPYTIAHLKLSMTFRNTGFRHFNNRRLGVYLTNSLEGIDSSAVAASTTFGFADSITQESSDAMKIKNNTPIMVIVGNPPYSISSSNKGEWITKQLLEYKKDLDEKNIQPLSDDYIKFIRLTEYFISNNNSGIVAMITNNSFLDGTIHRQMRKHLLETFNSIYILNLHGSSRLQEQSPGGGRDENVFNIQTGVSISIFIKDTTNEDLADVYHSDMYGSRKHKFSVLNSKTVQSIDWNKVNIKEPSYLFIPKSLKKVTKYESGFALDEIFKQSTSGIGTYDDKNLVSFEEFTESEHSRRYLYRPFDFRYIDYDLKKVARDRYKVMRYMIDDNLALVAPKMCKGNDGFQHGFIANCLVDKFCNDKYSGYMFPLSVQVPIDSNVQSNGLYGSEWVSNIDAIVKEKIDKIVGQTSDVSILDYIIATMYSEKYRDEFAELLVIDYARIPYPKNPDYFKKLVRLGSNIRKVHLFEHERLQSPATSFPVDGSCMVEKKAKFLNNRVYINSDQYFGNISDYAWNYSIGGYKPSQKYLNDRKGRVLTNNELESYQKIIAGIDYLKGVVRKIDTIY